MTLHIHRLVVAATWLISFAHADSCTSSCAIEFAKCHAYQSTSMSGTAAYTQCRTEIDDGATKLINNGCVIGCTSTADMIALNTNDGLETTERSDLTTPQSSGLTTTLKNNDGTDSSKPCTPTKCDPVNQGRCDCSTDAGFTTYTFWINDNVQR